MDFSIFEINMQQRNSFWAKKFGTCLKKRCFEASDEWIANHIPWYNIHSWRAVSINEIMNCANMVLNERRTDSGRFISRFSIVFVCVCVWQRRDNWVDRFSFWIIMEMLFILFGFCYDSQFILGNLYFVATDLNHVFDCLSLPFVFFLCVFRSLFVRWNRFRMCESQMKMSHHKIGQSYFFLHWAMAAILIFPHRYYYYYVIIYYWIIMMVFVIYFSYAFI